MNVPVGATLASATSKRGGRRRGKGNGAATANPTPAVASADVKCPVETLAYSELFEALENRASANMMANMYEETPGRGGQASSKRNKSKNQGGGARRTAGLQTQFSLLPYPRGILNNSNYCFMNSVMQALAFIPPVAQLAVCAARDADASPQLPTLTVVGKWLLEYWKPAPMRQSLRPPRFAFSMRATNSSRPTASGVDGTFQEDAQEFLQLLLEHIHQELVSFESGLRDARGADGGDTDESWGEANTGGGKGWLTVKGNEKVAVRAHVDSEGRSLLLDSIFGGTLESRLKGKAKQKNHTSAVLERYYTIPVDIGYACESTIEDALARTFSVETIHDEKRDKYLKKGLFLDKLPQVLILHLRRWAMTAEGDLVKLDNHVSFSPTLVLPSVVCSDSKCPASNRTYSLLSVVAHRGGGTRQGHYVTFVAQHAAAPSDKAAVAPSVLDPDNSSRAAPSSSDVVLCNDTKVSVEPFQSLGKETVYFLLYQKRQ